MQAHPAFNVMQISIFNAFNMQALYMQESREPGSPAFQLFNDFEMDCGCLDQDGRLFHQSNGRLDDIIVHGDLDLTS